MSWTTGHTKPIMPMIKRRQLVEEMAKWRNTCLKSIEPLRSGDPVIADLQELADMIERKAELIADHEGVLREGFIDHFKYAEG